MKSKTGCAVEQFIYEYDLSQGGKTYEVRVKMTTKCKLYKRFDRLEHARRYRDMLLKQRDRLKRRYAS